MFKKMETAFGRWDVLVEKYGMVRSWLRYGIKFEQRLRHFEQSAEEADSRRGTSKNTR